MLHVVLKYTEVVTNTTFEKISTTLLEWWAGVWVESNGPQQSSDGDFSVARIENFRRNLT